MSEEIKPGMRFMNGSLLEVVKPNPKIPGDWFCQSVEYDVGLWSYSERTIIKGLVRSDDKL